MQCSTEAVRHGGTAAAAAAAGKNIFEKKRACTLHCVKRARAALRSRARMSSGHRGGVKSAAQLTGWKLAMRERLERRVRASRAALSAALRGARGGAGGGGGSGQLSEMLQDLVAEESARRVDAHAAAGSGGGEGDGDDADDELSDEERLAILLHLEETFYREAKAHGACARGPLRAALIAHAVAEAAACGALARQCRFIISIFSLLSLSDKQP